MALPQSFTSLLTNWANAAQGSASSLVDQTVGSILRAINEATAFVVLWLQGLALKGAALARASTCSGDDLDSWFAQFGFSRLGAVSATMQETFGRYTPTNQALVPVGAAVQSKDGSVSFTVVADTANAAYSTSLGAYVLAAGVASVGVAVRCTTPGSLGNVQAGTITSLGSGISVDYVTNPSAAVNGLDAENDPAARARFVLWIASLKSATISAVMAAIAGVQQGMSGVVAENTQIDGSTRYGYFSAVVNNGAGTATSSQLANAGAAIEAVRPLCIAYGVFAPSTLAANVSMTITTASGYVHATVVAQVASALQAYIASIKTTSAGAVLPWSSLAAQAYGIAGVTNVTNVLLNGGTVDLNATFAQAFQVGTVAVS